ncbi:hypothetical protein C8J56DRAFT_987924 [Mycena floridula]|nr:hypothetical protein C8J56DRAFT_987924 [Mycena floridula]
MSVTRMRYFDDRDDAYRYSTGWTFLTGNRQVDFGTAHSTDQVGSSATLIFSTVGAHANLTVKGMIPLGDVTHSTYSIDGSAPVSFSTMALAPDATEPRGQVPFFGTTLEKSGPHTLVITYAGRNTYILDDIVVQDAEPKTVKVGTVAGPVVAIMALLVVIIAAVVLYRRSRKPKGDLETDTSAIAPLLSQPTPRYI